MTLPLILGIGAAIAGVAGVGTGIHGAVKMKSAKDTMESAKSRHEDNIARFEKQNKETTEIMDNLGKKELEILHSFDKFSQLIEKIQSKPDIKNINIEGVNLSEYNPEEIKEASVGAGVLLGGIGGAVAGTAGGFAAAGATTAAVMALGTASTGTAIASLTGVAATNATLAALGGGALAAGGGGIALGTTVLGASTLGIGLLVGGIIFSITGSSISNKADEAWSQMKKAEKSIDKSCEYMKKLKVEASRFIDELSRINDIYKNRYYFRLYEIVEIDKKTNYNNFSVKEKLILKNTIMLVSVLYNMCKVKFVLQSEDEKEPNKVNIEEINKSLSDADKILGQIDPEYVKKSQS